MNTELIRKWADALDSHGYVQTYSTYLGATKVCACAVGVLLIELHEDSTEPLTLATNEDGTYRCCWATEPLLSFKETLRLRGIPENVYSDVLIMNDINRMPFEGIAAWLRVVADQGDATIDAVVAS